MEKLESLSGAQQIAENMNKIVILCHTWFAWVPAPGCGLLGHMRMRFNRSADSSRARKRGRLRPVSRTGSRRVHFPCLSSFPPHASKRAQLIDTPEMRTPLVCKNFVSFVYLLFPRKCVCVYVCVCRTSTCLNMRKHYAIRIVGSLFGKH